jgi:hypothetical protein
VIHGSKRGIPPRFLTVVGGFLEGYDSKSVFPLEHAV